MKAVISYLADVLTVFTIFLLLPLIICVIYKESPYYFVISILIATLIAVILKVIIRAKYNDIKDEVLSLGEGFTLTATSFLIMCLVGCIPFLEYFNWNFLNSLFVSVSGFTTTGLSMFPLPFELPKSLLFWFTETQWIGGLGIVLFFLTLISAMAKRQPSQQMDHLSSGWSLLESQGFTQRFDFSLRKMTHKIFLLYLFFTGVGVMLLYLTGLDIFTCIVLSFSTISTGGLINPGMVYPARVLFVLCLLMITGAISFLAHLKLFNKELKEYYHNVGFYLIIGITLVTAAFIILPKTETIFHVISAITTTGHALTPLTGIAPMVFFIIILCMLMGGTVGSTAGGIKTTRILLALKSIWWYTKKVTSPRNAVIPLKNNDESLEAEHLVPMFIFIFSYLILIILGVTAFMLIGQFAGTGYTISDSFFNVASALGNVGLSTVPLLTAPALAKVLLIVLMLFGRMEIFPILILIRKMFSR